MGREFCVSGSRGRRGADVSRTRELADDDGQLRGNHRGVACDRERADEREGGGMTKTTTEMERLARIAERYADQFPFDYVGGGYWRERGIPKGVPAKIIHGREALMEALIFIQSQAATTQ